MNSLLAGVTMDQIELINRCLSGDQRKKRISDSAIEFHIESDFYTYCEYFAPEDEQDPESIYLQLLTDKGREHELRTLYQISPNIKENTIDNKIRAFRYAIGEMFKGTPLLAGYSLFYLPLEYEGHIDLLRRNDSHPSIFGNHYYEIVEVKLAKRIQEKHVLQAIFYNELIGKIQEYYPNEVYVINGELNEESYSFKEYRSLLYTIIDDIKAIRNKERYPIPAYGSCPQPWENYANKIATENRDVTCIFELGKSLQSKLYEKGIKTTDDLAVTSEETLLTIKGIGKKKAPLFKQRAIALVDNKAKRIAKADFSSNNIEIYVDFEGVDPALSPIDYEAFVFLYGVIIRDVSKADAQFKYFLIRDPFDNEEVSKTTEKFIDLLLVYPEAPIYHWHHYEKTMLNKITKECNLIDKYDDIIERFVDLYKVVRDSWIFPISKLSLKYVAPYLGFAWRQSEMDGRVAIAKYIQYLFSDFKSDLELKEIIEYNEDDIKALIHIKAWLLRN